MDFIEWFASSPTWPADALRCFANFGLSMADMPAALTDVADQRVRCEAGGPTMLASGTGAMAGGRDGVSTGGR